ncbi:hypothetical protein TSEDIMI_210019 [Tenacibaculum sediminilitoris]|uniref:GTP cyclohydrolase I n=1 Tax=Tenacibaculum sediminilitoris TaxID=1820334 RepID=UPI003896395B
MYIDKMFSELNLANKSKIALFENNYQYNQIARYLQEILQTKDVAVIIDTKHLYVPSRRVKDDSSSTVTCFYGGIFNTPEKIVELQNYLK